MPKKLLLLAILLLAISTTQAANQAREHLVANELIERIGERQVVWLGKEGKPFLALKADYSSVRRRGGIILLHDLDGHPDWPEIISPLRNTLPEKGWPTLSVQLPLLSTEQDFTPANQQRILDEAKDRLIAAVEYFTNVGIYNIVLLGQGMGATAISHFLSGDLKQSHAIYIKAFIAIRFRTPEQLPEAYQPQSLLRLKTSFPILDIIADQESPEALEQAHLRKMVAKQSQNPNYRQERLFNANNNFRDAEGLLVSRINGWLKVNAAGAEVELEQLDKQRPRVN